MRDGRTELDLTGLKCPLPALRTRKALRSLPPATRFTVLCTDPMAAIDIPNVVREEGGVVEETLREGASLRFRILCGGFAMPPHS